MKNIILAIALVLIIPTSSAAILDPSLKISVGSEIFSGVTYPTVTLENSIQKIIIRTQSGGIGTGGVESVIKDWILKSTGTDMVGKFVDANSFRGALSSATITVNGENSKTVRLKYARGSIVEYTIEANNPVIKIKYEKYDVITTSNIVDRLSFGGTTRVYGQGGWIRSITGSYYPCAYWDTYDTTLGGCSITYGPDPANPGSLNYKGHIIMAIGQTGSSGIGFGRVMPIYTGTNGGIRILKIFSSGGGFEPYQAIGSQPTRPAHYGYIFMFRNGVDNAIIQGQRIVDGLSSPTTSINLVSPNGGENLLRGTTNTISWSSTGSPGANVKIELLKGTTPYAINSNTPNDGAYSWTVPPTQQLGTDYKIKVTSLTNSIYSDTSDNNFAISDSPVQSSNLVVNPSLEIDANSDLKPDSWYTNVYGGTASKIAFTLTTDAKYSGSRSVKISSSDPYGKARWMTGRNIAVSSGKTYNFGGYIKTNSVGKAQICTTFWSSGLSYISSACTGSKTGTIDWSVIQGNAVAPSGSAYARVELKEEGTGTVWYDEIMLKTTQ